MVAERYASVGEFVDSHREVVDPTVGRIIAAAGRLPAWQLADDLRRIAAARRRAATRFDDVDVIVLPTVPRLPTVDQVSDGPIEVNSMLGTYTNFVNLLDLSAVTVPVGPPTEPSAAHPSGHPPHSLTLIGPAWSDRVLVSLATALAGEPASHRVP
jgi:allophanate hydrolase